MQTETYLTPNQVADLLMVNPVTVRHWALEGRLKCMTTPGGHRRFARSDVELFARQHGAGLSEENNYADHRVMVVDDNRGFASFLVDLLTTEAPQLTVEAAYDGFEAGEKLHTFKPGVVLLDLMMPGMDGFDTCQRIKQNPVTSDVRVIAMTAHVSEENVERIIKAGAESCLTKPIKAPTLLQTIGIETIQKKAP